MQGCRTHLEGGAPFFFRIEEVSGTALDRSGDGGARTEVNVPILVNGSWVGVVGAADPDPNRTWQSYELGLLRTLAGLTAAFWQRVEDLRVRDSLIGSLDGRLRYEEALAKLSTALLGERGVGVEAALESIGVAARVDEVYITRTTAQDDGSPSARVIAGWVQPGLVPIHPIERTVSYRDMPAILEAIHQGSLARTMDGTNAEIVVGIEVGGGWFGSVGFLRRKASRSWSKRDAAFLRTIADILGAYYERMENRSRLESLISSKDQLIASVSHELRTPLTAVVGLAEELKENSGAIEGDEKDQLIDVIAKESREMADLVEDLLIAARSGDGSVPVFPERTDLSLLAASVATSLTVPDTVSLVVEDHPSAAYADPVRVRQVIRNLLTNAMRYGGTNVIVSFGTDEGLAYLDVHDDGHGIPAHDLEAVFEPYGRAASSRTVPGSVGLGLTLSKRLSELMGGSLSYVAGEGCTFRLTVPAAPEAPGAAVAS
jgi:signal transduction histidine kinase